MNVSWLFHRRSFPACANGFRSVSQRSGVAHAGQDDSAVRWAGGVGDLFYAAIISKPSTVPTLQRLF